MRTRTLIVAIAMLVLPVRESAASCENMIYAQSRELWFVYGDVYPTRRSLPSTPAVESTLVADHRAMWNGMARSLATVAACQRRIDSDPRLKALLRQRRISLAKYGSQPIQRVKDSDDSPPAASDSLLDLFRGLDDDSTAQLYAIRLGSFSDLASAQRCLARFAWLARLRNRCRWDSTLVMDWNHEDCSVGDCDRPTLFMLPPAVSKTGRWTVLSGLLVARRDADSWLLKVRRRDSPAARVVRIRVTGEVLEAAIPPT